MMVTGAAGEGVRELEARWSKVIRLQSEIGKFQGSNEQDCDYS